MPSDQITDSNGARLDGQFTNTTVNTNNSVATAGSALPSGANGVANSDFDFLFNLNPGDAAGPTTATDTTVTTVADLTLVHSHLNQSTTNSTSYTPYADLIGSGTITTISDLTAVHAHLNNQLPSAVPTFPSQSTDAGSGGIVGGNSDAAVGTSDVVDSLTVTGTRGASAISPAVVGAAQVELCGELGHERPRLPPRPRRRLIRS